MSRLSFRPRPLDIHKKLPIVKSIKDFEDDEAPASTRNSQLLRLAPEVDNEVHHVPSKKIAAEIPTPQFVVVDTYERDYSCTFSQPTSYLRARGGTATVSLVILFNDIATILKGSSEIPILVLKFLPILPARAELGEFVEYDLDNEDEDWLLEFNKEQKLLTPEM